MSSETAPALSPALCQPSPRTGTGTSRIQISGEFSLGSQRRWGDTHQTHDDTVLQEYHQGHWNDDHQAQCRRFADRKIFRPYPSSVRGSMAVASGHGSSPDPAFGTVELLRRGEVHPDGPSSSSRDRCTGLATPRTRTWQRDPAGRLDHGDRVHHSSGGRGRSRSHTSKTHRVTTAHQR